MFPPEILQLFTDKMLVKKQLSEPASRSLFEDMDLKTAYRFECNAKELRDRMILLGYSTRKALGEIQDVCDQQIATLNESGQNDLFADAFESLDQQKLDDLKSLIVDVQSSNPFLIKRHIESCQPDSEDPNEPVGSISWLRNRISTPSILRLMCDYLPDASVILDITYLIDRNRIEEKDAATLASRAASEQQSEALNLGPVIVITEGSTDARYLQAALELLTPHLADLIRIWQFSEQNRPEAGAGMIYKYMQAFDSAGIRQRTLGIFDNDAAGLAAFEATQEKERKLSSNFRCCHYPDTAIASNYPTAGPPTLEHPTGSNDSANVNGHAAAIELYLGDDVLRGHDGELYPIVWGSITNKRYMGSLSKNHKTAVQNAFQDKVKKARKMGISDPTAWRDLQSIIQTIVGVFDE